MVRESGAYQKVSRLGESEEKVLGFIQGLYFLSRYIVAISISF